MIYSSYVDSEILLGIASLQVYNDKTNLIFLVLFGWHPSSRFDSIAKNGVKNIIEAVNIWILSK